MDKRHDLAPGILRYWTLKLVEYSDVEVSKALVRYRGEFFPSVDDVIELIEQNREAEIARAEQAKTDALLEDMRQARAERERQDWTHGIERCKEILAEADKRVKRMPAPEPEPRIYEVPAERRRQLQEQARMLTCRKANANECI